MILLWIRTHCCFCHIRWFGVNRTLMWHDRIFICFIYANFIFPQSFCYENFGSDPWVFLINNHAMIVMRSVYFWQIYNTHNHTWICILMKNFNWGGNNERSLESLIMILFSEYLAYLGPPSSMSLTILLWSSWMRTCSKTFVASCGSV